MCLRRLHRFGSPHNPLANIEDGSCRFDVCPDFDGNGNINLGDLLNLLVGYEGDNLLNGSDDD